MLAICGGKGGTGKTTTTVALARALGRTDRAVTAVDCDRDLPDLHSVTGVDRTPTLADLAPDEPPRTVRQSVPETPGVGVIAAPPATGAVPVERRLGELSETDRTVLLDCPAGVGPDAVAPLRAADRCLLVSDATERSLADTAKTAAVARRVGAAPVGTVLTRTERDPGVATLFNVPTLACVPSVTSPLSRRCVARAAERCLSDV